MDRVIITGIIALILVIVATFTFLLYSVPTSDHICLSSGGVEQETLCCTSVGDYPNLCVIGACGCSPENSHEVKICNCGEGRCFDGTRCVDYEPEMSAGCTSRSGQVMGLPEAFAIAGAGNQVP